jgi:hypothetical protein
MDKEDIKEISTEYFHSPRILLGENVSDKALKILINLWKKESV